MSSEFILQIIGIPRCKVVILCDCVQFKWGPFNSNFSVMLKRVFFNQFFQTRLGFFDSNIIKILALLLLDNLGFSARLSLDEFDNRKHLFLNRNVINSEVFFMFRF